MFPSGYDPVKSANADAVHSTASSWGTRLALRCISLATRCGEVTIIRSMPPISGGSEFVFPAFHTMKKPISDNAVNQALRRLGYAGVMTAHGFRATASSLLNEEGRWPPDIIEHALAHKDRDAVRAIYNRTTCWKARAEMMQAWSDRLDVLRDSEFIMQLAA